ncbi:MAG: tRNA glutamyl-Q(34) synthetase GluQRS [Salinisphaeraceae bacterium]|nr:tRNA glutamyl-Q(34) synthetase GluQRS [Salinisphaeraceae bacterium]
MRGRFAPSPTGPLHLGSVYAAIASYLDVRSRDGQWLLRIEDIDPPREVEGAAELICRSLDSLALNWDEPPLFQSTRSAAYAGALDTLRHRGLSFDCGCTRRHLRAEARTGPEGFIYPGTCRDGVPVDRTPRAVRLRVTPQVIRLHDTIQGEQSQELSSEVGDFVIRRADGPYAYQLAVVVDDAWQGITRVLRGTDLLGSTARQVYLQQCLDLPRPDYLHVPVLLGPNGEKFSKSAGDTVDHIGRRASALWCFSLDLLGQRPPPSMMKEPVSTISQWAIRYWQPSELPCGKSIGWSSVSLAMHRWGIASD